MRSVLAVGRGVGLWLRSTVTPVGWFVAIGAAVGAIAWTAWGWAEALVVGVTCVLLLTVATPFLLGGRSYEVSFELPRSRIIVGQSTTATLHVSNTGRGVSLPCRLEILLGDVGTQLHVPPLAPGVEWRHDVDVPGATRGVVRVGPVRSIRGDPVGVLRRVVDLAGSQCVWVHPQTVMLPTAAVGALHDLDGIPSRMISSSDLDFHALREYEPGDEPRHIHWKGTAKTGTLMVRQYEESRRSAVAVIMSTLSADYRDAAEFELAVGAAASLGLLGIRLGRNTRVLASALIPAPGGASNRPLAALPSTSRVALLDAASAVAVGDNRTSMRTTVGLASTLLEPNSVAFLVCGSVLGLRGMLSTTFRLPTGVSAVAVVCDPMAVPQRTRIGDVDVFAIAVLDDLPPLIRRGAL